MIIGFDILSVIFLIAGTFFLLVGSFGVIRFPDFYSRTHAAGKCDTLGLILVLVGLGIHLGFSLETVKLFFVAIFIAIANPTATHAIARAAYHLGLKPKLSGNKKIQCESTKVENDDIAS